MTYLARFKANLAAGSAFSSNKIKKTVFVESRDDELVDCKTVINWNAIFVEPDTAQGVVAAAIMAPFAILAAPLAIPLAMLAGWATSPKRQGEVGGEHKHPIMAGVALVTLKYPVFAVFIAIRLVVTPFTEFANLVKSAYKAAATTKDGDMVEPSFYAVRPIIEKSDNIALNVWTLGLLLLVPAIKRLVTLDGQIEGLKDRLTAVELKRDERMRELLEHYDKLYGHVYHLQQSKSPDTDLIEKARKAVTAFKAKIGKEMSSFKAELGDIINKIIVKEKALNDKKNKGQAKETEGSKAQSSKKSDPPLPARTPLKASMSQIAEMYTPLSVPPLLASGEGISATSGDSESTNYAKNPSSSTGHVASPGNSTSPSL